MINLFEEDRQSETHELQEEIKTYFYNRYKYTSDLDNKLQNSLNQWRSLSTYQFFRSENKKIAGRINQLYEKYKIYLDSTEASFIASFSKQCWQSIFELAMAELISKKFCLTEKSQPPDLIFNASKKLYFLECGSCTTSMMDKYDKYLPGFDLIFGVAYIFFCEI